MNGFEQSAGVSPETVSLFIRMLLGGSLFVFWGGYQVYAQYYQISKNQTDVEDLLLIAGRIFFVLALFILIVY